MRHQCQKATRSKTSFSRLCQVAGHSQTLAFSRCLLQQTGNVQMKFNTEITNLVSQTAFSGAGYDNRTPLTTHSPNSFYSCRTLEGWQERGKGDHFCSSRFRGALHHLFLQNTFLDTAVESQILDWPLRKHKKFRLFWGRCWSGNILVGNNFFAFLVTKYRVQKINKLYILNSL